ncbi:hypothetical protein Daus18300_008832 [Diaporthe australafricana]|uniref:Interferon-induced 6-16 n=1 Tax=Diaporthe australafricana TaxID=127596 RepID=A0ABR3WGQ8_9PEZI
MNSLMTATEAGITAVKWAAQPEIHRAALLTVTEKGKQLTKAAPGAASQAGLANVRTQAAGWVTANPGTAACIAVGAVGVPFIVAPMAAAAPVLGAAGFGSSGIVGGSVAAGSMGSGVAAGSAFAYVQSAAMGGYGVAAVSGAVQGAGAAVAGISGGLATWIQRKGSNKQKDSDKTEES